MLRSIYLILFIHVGGLHAMEIANQTSVEGYKRAAGNKNAFSNNFDTCMINQWITDGVLRSSPTASCDTRSHARLCYGTVDRRPNNAQYISCYNTAKLIPDFTAYVVRSGPAPKGYKRPGDFRKDNGPYAPRPQSTNNNYKNEAKYPYNRGHLTPSGAFNTKTERDLTFIMTNVAPQMPEFNGGNWAAVEKAVKKYVQYVGYDVYVFTGTAGKFKDWLMRTFQISVGGPVAPKYFWKAVCDPVEHESIFFIAKNNFGVTETTKERSASCYGINMTKKKGVIECKSISEAARRWFRNRWHGIAVPDFDPTNCGTANKGNFLAKYLRKEIE